MISKKIITLDQITKIARSSKKKISLVHGVFDVLHVGHKKHFELAKSFADILVVSITSDKFVKKGPSRPLFNQNFRSEMVSSLEMVDFVVMSNFETAVNVINELKPDFYVKGQDYKNLKNDLTGNIYLEKKAVEKNNGQIIFTDEIQFSSSNIINNYFKNDFILDDVKKLNINLKNFKDECINSLKKISKLKIAIIGEIIIDEYIFSDEMDKPSKENISAVKYKYNDVYLGGVIAIAKNLSEFCKKIDIYSAGKFTKPESKLIKSINKYFDNIKIKLIDNNFNSIRKTRVIEGSNKKIFEIYYKNGNNNLKSIKKLNSLVKNNFSKYDVVILADFGHGFFHRKIFDEIKKRSKYLSINTQTNSDNRGFNYITKYPSANTICIDRPEIQLALSDKESTLIELSKKLSKRVNFENLIITLGNDGIFVLDNKKNKNASHVKLSAFEINPVDTIGAGDAVFGISSLLLSQKVNFNVVAFLGNIFGAFSTKIVGHSSYIKKKDIFKSILYTLK